MNVDSSKRIRIEIILPLKYNNGQLVEISKFLETKRELIERFGGRTGLTTTSGAWKSPSTGNIVDEFVTGFFVVAPDTNETREFLRDYKEILKERFNQEDIMITCHLIELI